MSTKQLPLSVFIFLLFAWSFSQSGIYAQCSGQVLSISSPNPSQNGVTANWGVPSGGPYKVRIVAKGAKGGDAIITGRTGGNGAFMTGEFMVASGQNLEAIAGAPGGTFYLGGGGAGSGVQISGGGPLVIAAGGGGAFFGNGGDGIISNTGSNGGTGNGNGGSGGGGYGSNGGNGGFGSSGGGMGFGG